MRYLSNNVRFKFGFEWRDSTVNYDKTVDGKDEYNVLDRFFDYWDWLLCDLFNSDDSYKEYMCKNEDTVECILTLLQHYNKLRGVKIDSPMNNLSLKEAMEIDPKIVFKTLNEVFEGITSYFGFTPYLSDKKHYGMLSFILIKKDAQIQITRRRAEELLLSLSQRNYKIID